VSLLTLMCHEVTILRAGSTTNRYEETAKDWTSPRRRTSRARIAQRSSVEDNDGREARSTGWVCYLPPDTDILALDRIVWDGVTYEVKGAPHRAYDRRQLHHVEVELELVEG
jgi:head-tail adaptor